MFAIWQMFNGGQRKNCRLMQNVMCHVIRFATTGRVLSATDKDHGSVDTYLPDCTVLLPRKSRCHFSCSSFYVSVVY